MATCPLTSSFLSPGGACGTGSPERSFLLRAAALDTRRSSALRVRASAAEPDLSVRVNGLQMPNPFVIGSGPPGTNYTVMKRAFDEGWGAVIAKTVSLDSSKVINVTPRYARLRARSNGSAKGEIIGWENIELISDRPLETMLREFKRLKEEYPDRILIASIMEEYDKAAWQELIERVEETGVDAFEINFSCPHGMPERKMGAAVGQNCVLLDEVCGWINEKATIPVWAKMTPNITDITEVCTGVMMQGYGLVKQLCAELKDFMRKHNFSSIDDFKGHSLQYFTTHTDLVQRQQEAIRQRKAVKKGLQSDKDWTGDGFVKETESMVSN